MACVDPHPAFRAASGKIFLYHPQRPSDERIEVACGTCIGCQKAKAQGWALRCTLELTQHVRGAVFATLTYREERVPVTLSRRHLALFVKRLRKALGPARPIRFFACGEYGEARGRPHYHAIIYGLDERDRAAIEKAWTDGYTYTVRATPPAINYVAGYCAKKLGQPALAKSERIDYETGELYTYQPPFIQMSRRPGIGGHARQWPQSWRSYAIYNGRKQPVPRFLHEAWKATATPEEIETLTREKAQYSEGRDRSERALEAERAIALAKQALAAGRRKL